MLGIALVCLAAVLWGTVGVAARLMTAPDALDPAVAGFVRTALGAAALLAGALTLRLPHAAWRSLPVGDLLLFGLAGAVFQTCLFAAFAEVGVTVTVAVTVCAPVVLVATTGFVLGRSVPKPGVLLAIGTAAAGVLLALPAAGRSTLAVGLLGTTLLVSASIAFAVVATSARRMTRRLHPLQATGLGLATTAVVLGAMVLPRSAALGDVARLPPLDLAILAYTGLAATGGAYLAFALGMRLSRSALAGLAATLIEPGVAALLAALMLREQLSVTQTGGCAMMLAAMVGLFECERRQAREPGPG